MKKKNKIKATRKKTWDEEIALFAMKIIGGASFFFILALGLDIYYQIK